MVRHAKKLSVDSDKFVALANSLLTALTIDQFETCCSTTRAFLVSNENLTGWFEWWYARRMHIFSAFKPADAPTTNLAEIGHSKMTSVGRQYMTLLETAKQDIATAIRQESELKQFSSGLSKGGKAPSLQQRQAKKYRADIRRAAVFGEEVCEGITEQQQPSVYVPKRGKHRPPENKLKHVNIPKKIDSDICCIVLFGSITNLKKCYGCGKAFSKKQQKTPNDVIIKNFCNRKYFKAGKEVLSHNVQAAYFHLNLNCVRKMFPKLETEDIIVHDEQRSKLTEERIFVLLNFGIVI